MALTYKESRIEELTDINSIKELISDLNAIAEGKVKSIKLNGVYLTLINKTASQIIINLKG